MIYSQGNHYSIPAQSALTGAVREQDLEIRIVRWWAQIRPGTVLLTRTAEKILVIDPGVRNQGEGPDFQKACFFYRGRYLTGDVECHRRARDWFSHGHLQNPQYQSVKIHLLGSATPLDTKLNGIVVYCPKEGIATPTCRLEQRLLSKEWPKILHQFSQKRWQRKVRFFRTAPETGFNTRLFSTFRLLGKGGNEASFLSLAALVDEQIKDGFDGMKLDKMFPEWVSRIQWKKGGIRPAQQPQNRFPLAKTLIRFNFQFHPLWWCRPDQFEAAFSSQFHSLGGVGIQTELKGNVFYPYLAGLSLDRENLVYYRHWVARFNALKLPYSYGKYWRRFQSSLGPTVLHSFPLLQGLLELDRQYCSGHHCALCPLKGWNGYLE
jgi:hypothetical protein